jgi:PPK2 family polyphosphate:nucleotide phosphotransferase
MLVGGRHERGGSMAYDERMRKLIAQIAAPCRVAKGSGFSLLAHDPGHSAGIGSEFKPEARELLAEGIGRLSRLQDLLYANDRWGVLMVLQGMDAAGKDSTIKHVMSGVNPQGCEVHAFKPPSAEELDHDFLWRYCLRLPRRGRIGIFNRSYYEEVLVVRVHQALLRAEKLPREMMGPQVWKHRLEDIASLERYLARNGILVLKIFLNVSRAEQKRRLLARLDIPSKNWKLSSSDVAERQYWKRYMAAYQDAIRHTAAPHAPWYVVPADKKWFSQLAVAAILVDTLENLKLNYPAGGKAREEEIALARQMLNRPGA